PILSSRRQFRLSREGIALLLLRPARFGPVCSRLGGRAILVCEGGLPAPMPGYRCGAAAARNAPFTGQNSGVDGSRTDQLPARGSLARPAVRGGRRAASGCARDDLGLGFARQCAPDRGALYVRSSYPVP